MDMKLEVCTRAAYEAVRGYLFLLGDEAWPPWDDAAPWRRDGMAAVVTSTLNGGMMDHAHAAWLNYMAVQQWAWGPLFNEAEKKHPWMRTVEREHGSMSGGMEKAYEMMVMVAKAAGRVVNIRMRK
jgi:hypothetical protein